MGSGIADCCDPPKGVVALASCKDCESEDEKGAMKHCRSRYNLQCDVCSVAVKVSSRQWSEILQGKYLCIGFDYMKTIAK